MFYIYTVPFINEPSSDNKTRLFNMVYFSLNHLDWQYFLTCYFLITAEWKVSLNLLFPTEKMQIEIDQYIFWNHVNFLKLFQLKTSVSIYVWVQGESEKKSSKELAWHFKNGIFEFFSLKYLISKFASALL